MLRTYFSTLPVNSIDAVFYSNLVAQVRCHRNLASQFRHLSSYSLRINDVREFQRMHHERLTHERMLRKIRRRFRVNAKDIKNA